MSKATSRMNTKRLKAVVVMFCLVTGGASIYIFLNALLFPASDGSIHIQQTVVPSYFNRTGDEAMLNEPMIDEHTIAQIKQFRKQMDSLQRTNRSVYDSILLARPKLLDSIVMLEHLYQQQNLE